MARALCRALFEFRRISDTSSKIALQPKHRRLHEKIDQPLRFLEDAIPSILGFLHLTKQNRIVVYGSQ
jgi:hypothetical protein